MLFMKSTSHYQLARNNSIALLTPHNPYMDLETSTSAA